MLYLDNLLLYLVYEGQESVGAIIFLSLSACKAAFSGLRAQVFKDVFLKRIMMQLTAKLTQVLPLQTGTGRNGEWKKQDIIVETDGQYPKKICISIWGDRINESQLKPGNELKIDFDIESREYNGRWYTDVKAWKIEVAGAVEPQAPPIGPEDYGIGVSENEASDDLPF